MRWLLGFKMRHEERRLREASVFMELEKPPILRLSWR